MIEEIGSSNEVSILSQVIQEENADESSDNTPIDPKDIDNGLLIDRVISN